MKNRTTAGSFKSIFEGFRRISKDEQIAYLNYLDLLIKRDTPEKWLLVRFKAKLEKQLDYALKN